MKKRFFALLGVVLIAALLPACGSTADAPEASQQQAENVVSDVMPTVVNTAEYTLYRNIFFNDMQADYDGKETIKEGTFATIHDAFNDVTRYYVWGYNDQTKCCDWQWELKMDDVSDLPTNGSLVRVTGTYETNEDGLDDFWIIHPQITVKTPFVGRDYDIDMQAMSDTLERVQTINISNRKDVFEGKTVCGYGRVQNENTLKDPYYDNSWTVAISGEYEVPAFGTMVLVSGTIRDGVIADCEIASNTQY